jgi:hypothetical protein
MPRAFLCGTMCVEPRMMRSLCLAGLSLAAILVVSSAQAGAATPRPNEVKQTAKPVWALAMDGPRVAYMSEGRVRVWNVVTGAISAIRGNYPSYHKYGGGDIGEVAIADKQVALITRFMTGNSQETTECLYTAPVGGQAHQLRSTYHYVKIGEPDENYGSWITGLVGSGHLVAVSSWEENASVSSNERLSLVTPTGLRTIVKGPGAIVSTSADGRHIAVLSSSTRTPTVGVYSAGGKLLRNIVPAGNVALGAGDAPGIALSGNRLVVLTEARTVEVYDWTTGSLVHTWPVAARDPKTLSLYGRLAVEGSSNLHLLDVTTGKDVVLARHGGGSGYGSQTPVIGPRGVVYAVSTSPSAKRPHGRLIFVPMARLLRLTAP